MVLLEEPDQQDCEDQLALQEQLDPVDPLVEMV